MPTVTYIESNGKPHTFAAESGLSLMQVAVDNMVPGILGDCGGACSCATCHAYIDPAWLDRLPPKSESEQMMLEGVEHLQDSSRLSCQIPLRDELDGVIVRLPPSQG